MATFKLSDATGCISPISGITSGFDFTFTTNNINLIVKIDDKKNTNNGFVDIYIVSVRFGNSSTLFKFTDEGNRDSFYSLIEGKL